MKRIILDRTLPTSQRVAAAAGVAPSAHESLVRLLLAVTGDGAESEEALREFGGLLSEVTEAVELTEWELRDMLPAAWEAYCG